MDAWIRDLINASVRGLKALADATWEKLAWLYGVIVTVGINVRSGWGKLRTAVSFYRDKLIATIAETASTLRYIIVIRIPQAVAAKASEIIAWAARTIDVIERRLTATIVALRDWVVDGIGRLAATARSIIEWATREFNELIDAVTRIARLVYTLLTDPARMAKWLLGALIAELVAFADEHAEMVLAWIRARSTYYAGRVAARIEDVLVRLL